MNAFRQVEREARNEQPPLGGGLFYRKRRGICRSALAHFQSRGFRMLQKASLGIQKALAANKICNFMHVW